MVKPHTRGHVHDGMAASSALATSCEAAARALRATGGSNLDEKITLATAILDTPSDSCFPGPHKFVLDWLFGALRAKPTADGCAPRDDARLWRLLDALLHQAIGCRAPVDDAAPPLQTSAQLPAGLRKQISLSNRVLLQAAAGALESSADGTHAAALSGRVRRVMRQLLVETTEQLRRDGYLE